MMPGIEQAAKVRFTLPLDADICQPAPQTPPWLLEEAAAAGTGIQA